MLARDEDPNRPFSVARVAVWALGIISLVAVAGQVAIEIVGSEPSASLRAVAQTGMGALAAVAAARVSGR